VKILALDWGERRLGFAVSDEGGTFSFPLEGAACGSEGEKRDAVLARLRETGAGKLLVGLPLTLGGEEGESARKVRRFVERFAGAFRVPVAFFDERMTTVLADRAAREGTGGRGGGRGRRREEASTDSAAACLLLSGYLESVARQAPGRDGEDTEATE